MYIFTRVKYTSVVFIIALIVAVSSGEAKDKTANKNIDHSRDTITINLYNSILIYGFPDWQKTYDIVAENEIFRDQKGPNFIQEFIPKGEKFKSWTQLFSVRASANFKGNIEDMIKGQLGVYVQGCTIENAKWQVIQKTDNKAIFLTFCSNSVNGPKNIGYGPGVGEVSIYWVAINEGTAVKVYHQWRGKSFDLKNQKTFPVKKHVVMRVLNRFHKFSVHSKDVLKKNKALPPKNE